MDTLGRWLCGFYLGLIGYRYRDPTRYLTPGLVLPRWLATAATLDTAEAKARASLTTSGVSFAFIIAILAALFALPESSNASRYTDFRLALRTVVETSDWSIRLGCSIAIALPYLLLRIERQITLYSLPEYDLPKNRDRTRRSLIWSYIILYILLVVAVGFLLVPSPLITPLSVEAVLFAGTVLMLIAAFFLFLSLEFLDTASGWRGELGFHFHMATIGSQSYVIGVSLALVGVSYLTCILSEPFGRITALVAILVSVSMSEIERAVWKLRSSLNLVIDYPEHGSALPGPSYTIRLRASDKADNVRVRIDDEKWRNARESGGYWWVDWADYSKREKPYFIVGEANYKGQSEQTKRRRVHYR